MKRSFACAANRDGFGVCSLAGLVKHSIQDLLTATVQERKQQTRLGYRLNDN
jgi:hypothetical protein